VADSLGIVEMCIRSIQGTVQSIAVLKDKHVFTLDDENLMARLKGVVPPAAGIMYEGLRSTGDTGVSARVGISGEIIISVVLISQSPKFSLREESIPAVRILDDLRQKIASTRSPTGHFWKFVVEAAADEKQGVVFWIQRWSAPVQMIHR